MSKKLTSKQEAFCVEYVKNGGNASAAYRHAYDCENSKDSTINRKALEVLENGKVTARIQEHQKKVNAKVEKKLGLEVVDVALMFKEMYYNAEKDADKLKAAENLMKHLGGYQKDNEQSKTVIDIPNINFNGDKSK